MPFKTSFDPAEVWTSNKWFLSIMISCIVLLLGAILAYAFQELGTQDNRILMLEKNKGITQQEISGLYQLIEERTKLLGAKLDSLRVLLEERTRRDQ